MKRGRLGRLVDWLRGYGSGLDDYEMAIVEAVARELDADSAGRLRRKARAINMVQRTLGGLSTNFYEKRGGKLVKPAETALRGMPRTARFAKFAVRSADPLSRLKGTIYLVEGRLFSMEFNQPTMFVDAGKIDDIKVTILGPPFIDPDAEQDAAGDWPV